VDRHRPSIDGFRTNSRHAIRAFARTAIEFLQAGIHVLIVDLFPPNRRNPLGIHKVIWDRLRDESIQLPPDVAPAKIASSKRRSSA